MRRRTTSKTWPSALKRPKLRSPRSSSTRCFTTRTVGGRQGAIVEKAVRNRVEVHFCPCKEHLYELEGEHGIGGLPKYVIYFKRPNDWRVICVPLETARFVCHKWRGKRDNKLEEVSGTEGANFCHQTASTGETGRVRVALQIAVVSLEEKEDADFLTSEETFETYFDKSGGFGAGLSNTTLHYTGRFCEKYENTAGMKELLPVPQGGSSESRYYSDCD
ncbi:hypothetical protein pipiens_018559 [Culex pipiens pipiens]|uniref:Uncharacterized protein n=1 Tax=Culex pipiens pipiens TaxID=38569 RepID=A0ABD1CB66_CULPP